MKVSRIFPYFMPVREFGITDGPGHILLIQIWLTFIGFPIGYTAFFFYVVLSGLGTERYVVEPSTAVGAD
jgi:hypothetical protein